MQWGLEHMRKRLLGLSTAMELETLSKLDLFPPFILLTTSAGLVCEESILVGMSPTTSSTGASVTKARHL